MAFEDARARLNASLDGTEPPPLESADQQSEEDRELVAFVKKKVEEARSNQARVSSEAVWMTNIAYLLGFDSVYYDSVSRTFLPNNGAPVTSIRRNRLRANLLLPATQNTLARMLKAPPRYEVQPNSEDEDDKEAARLGEDLIGDVWNRQAINRKRIDLGMWTLQCGHAYIGVSYDDDQGPPIEDPGTNEVLGFEGEVRVDVVPAFEGFADPMAKTLEEAQWFARCKARKLDYFERYDRGNLVKEEGAWLLSTQYELRVNTLNTAGPQSTGTTEAMKHAAIEISYYERRTKKHPRGRHVIVANGVLLKNGELAVGEIPYAKFDDVVVAGKYFAESKITHARPLQDQYNRILSKRAQYTNLCLSGKIIAARSHGLTQEALNDQSGEVVEYDVVPGASEPKAMDMPTMPSYAYEESKEIESKIYAIFGLSEVSRGQLPSASIPAQGIQLLLEQDETRMGIETEQHEHSWAQVGKLILMYIAKCVRSERDLKKRAKTGGYQVKRYTGDSLLKNFDVSVVRGSTVPNSRVIGRQEILNLYNTGLLGDPSDVAVRDKVLGMLQYGETSEAWESHHLVKMQVNRDIDMIKAGLEPPVNEKDNHVIHLSAKNDYRISDKFLKLPPDNQAILEANMNAHLAILVKQMNPQLASPPMPPPPPRAAGPLMGEAAPSGAPPAPPV